MDKTIALITAGGRLDLLSELRSKAAMPFAGKFRLVDFTLSNCVNSGVEDIGIITQYMPNSLKRHLGIGKPWDLDRKKGGITILQPFKGPEKDYWSQGNAQSVYYHLSYLRSKETVEEVLILPGNLVYKMDYRKLIKEHRNNEAELTIAGNNISYQAAQHFSTIKYRPDFKITDIKQNQKPANNLVSMGVYVFNKNTLVEILDKYCNQGIVDFETGIIPKMVSEGRDVYLTKFDGYWKTIRTTQSYWKSNLETTENIPKLNLYDNDWPIYTRSEEKPPVKFGENSNTTKSLISNGAIVNGRVKNSVIAPGVYIEEGAMVKNSVILNNSIIRKNSEIDKTIIDKDVEIKENVQIGSGSDFTINSDAENTLENGLNLIAKDITIAKNIRVHRNCRINRDITADEFENNEVLSGTTVE